MGRHFRLDEKTKAIVGRNAMDNQTIERFCEPGDALIHVAQVPGPSTLIPGGGDEATRILASGLCARYSDAPRNAEVVTNCLRDGITTSLATFVPTPEETEQRII